MSSIARTRPCPSCARTVLAQVSSCRFCGAELQPRKPIGRNAGKPVIEPPKPTSGWVFLAVLIGILLLAIGLYRWQGGDELGQFPTIQLTPAQATSTLSPCATKPKCVIVVVAPWCPACHRSIGLIKSLRKRWLKSTEVGIKVVVARDSLSRTEAMARTIGDCTFVDPANKLMQALRRNQYPYWLTVDSSGKILAAFAGTYSPANAHVEKLNLN